MRTKKLDSNICIENQIESLRIARGWSKQKMSVISGVSRPTIIKAEKNHQSVTPECLAKIFKALEIKVTYEVAR